MLRRPGWHVPVLLTLFQADSFRVVIGTKSRIGKAIGNESALAIDAAGQDDGSHLITAPWKGMLNAVPMNMARTSTISAATSVTMNSAPMLVVPQ